ncbi:WG repeat-containing protein [Mangrovivirga sp. M17]|uniref:WG repeat-containing protein n=1 Tax=Mangrovivirga halotolerans TaxID=2993936 RepID=A0ABT3RW71_9BACT|nr:WG repeat-containing protein [Mangrovivirga halotolerans]MCX2746027.1 WG repeat-containing protein [Mangrovivirga halotolerans]
MIRQLFFILLAILSFSVSAQNRIFKLVGKADTAKAKDYVLKINDKDPNDPETKLATAYYLQWMYPENLKHLDSAASMLSKYLNIATEESKLSEEVHPDSLKIRIDSLAFQQLNPPHTQNRFLNFLTIHNTQPYSSQAKNIWEDWAYNTAIATHTDSAYNNFKRWFPNSQYISNIKRRQADLEFSQHFTEFSEKEYANFLRKNPNSPYIQEVENKLADLLTISGSKEKMSYLANQYPDLNLAKKAKLIVNSHYDESSKSELLYPIAQNAKIGLINSQGEYIVPAIFDRLESSDNCKGYESKYIIGYIGEATAVVNRSGKFVFRGPAENIIELSPAYISFVQNGKSGLLLSDGSIILPPIYDEIFFPHKNFIAARKSGLIEFRSLLGSLLMTIVDGDLYSEKDFIFHETDDQLKVSHVSMLPNIKTDFFPWIRNVYDYELANDSTLIIENENRQFGVLNENLQWLKSPAENKIYDTPFGIVVKDALGYRLAYDNMQNYTDPYNKLVNSKKWLLAKNDTSTVVYNQKWSAPLNLETDSSYILGENFLVTVTNEKPVVYFNNKKSINFTSGTGFKLISTTDKKENDQALISYKGRRQVVYNASGEQVFSGDGKSYSIMSDSVISIMFTSGNYMLKTLDGKTLLPGVYDGFQKLDDNNLVIVRDGKFGWINTKNYKVVAPRYSKLPVKDGARVLTKYGKYHYLLNTDGSLFYRSDSEDLKSWNDSSVWIKNNFRWTLWDINENDSAGIEAKTIRMHDLDKNENERLAIFLTENGYGAASSKYGQTIKPEYTGIEFRGNEAEIVFFAYRDFEEAGYRSIRYVNNNGSLLKEETSNLGSSEKILCD